LGTLLLTLATSDPGKLRGLAWTPASTSTSTEQLAEAEEVFIVSSGGS